MVNVHTFSIYALIDPRNNEIRYIGQTIRSLKNRLNNHICNSKKNSTHKDSWIISVLKSGHKPKIKLIQLCCSQECADNMERYYISLYFNLTNSESGGRRNKIPDKAVKEKQSEKRLLYWNNPTNKGNLVKLQQAGKQKNWSEIVEIYRNNVKNNIQSPEARIKAIIGIKKALNTEKYKEYKRKEIKERWKALPIEEKNRRSTIFSNAGQAKLREMGHYKSDKNIAHIKKLAEDWKNKKAKPFVGFKNGIKIGEWSNLIDGERDLGVMYQNICAVLKGRAKTAKGYVFKYK